MTGEAARPGVAFRDQLLAFVRTLRRAGMRLGPGDAQGALEAAAATGIADRDDLRRALAATLVRRPAEMPLFRHAFRLYFEQPASALRLDEPSAEDDGNAVPRDESEPTRLAEAMAAAGHGRERPRETRRREADRARSASALEVLRRKDFAEMTLEEAAMAREMLRESVLPLTPDPTRRFATHASGRRPDLRATLRRGVRDGGEYLELLRRRRRRREPAVILLGDISGSVSGYTRMFLHFAHALTSRRERVHTFLFGTRLTVVTRRLRDRDPDRSLALIAGDIDDWEGGTRIADSLRTFNRDWGRRVLAQGGVVVLLTDGLERRPDSRLGLEMERLAKSSRRLIWLNPLLRYDDFRPLARGIRLMLPHADDLVSAHNVESLDQLSQRLRDSLGRRGQAF
ncbi:MAG: VWA domain-containing protein [Gammaproteobacteria bacterium]